MKIINGAEVWGEHGLKIKYDQNRISYKKNTYATAISVEFMLNPVTLLLYVDTLRSWFPPHEKDHLSELDKKRIVDKVTEALRLLNVKYEIVQQDSFLE